MKELFIGSLTRNILTHNNGVVNRIYLQEIKNQGMSTTYKIGDSVFPKLTENITSLSKVVNTLSLAIFNYIKDRTAQIDKYALSLGS